MKPGFLFAALRRQHDRRAPLHRRRGGARRGARCWSTTRAALGLSPDARAPVAVIADANPRRRLALDGGALLRAAARDHRRRHRHQRQDLGRRFHPPDLAAPRPARRRASAPSASSARISRRPGSLTTPDPVALHRDLAALAARRHRSCRARGVEPRPRPVPPRRARARRRRLHQPDPRPSRLSPRHGGLFRAPRRGCSPSCCRRGGTAVLNPDSGRRSRASPTLCRDRGQRVIGFGAASGADLRLVAARADRDAARRSTLAAFGAAARRLSCR